MSIFKVNRIEKNVIMKIINSSKKETKKKENSKERVWRKGNSLTLLVEMQTSIANIENSVKIPLKNWQ